jgi:CDP-glycerol glycerophosphotransferase (TagB/SpsB family)
MPCERPMFRYEFGSANWKGRDVVARGGRSGVRRPSRELALRAGRLAISGLSRLVPKGQSAVIRSFPDFDDSTRSLTASLVARGIRTTILVESHTTGMPTWLNPSVRVLKVRSGRGVWTYLRSSMVLFTHGLYLSPRPPSNQIVVNVWHGMPIKAIGRDIGQHDPPRFSVTLATSDRFAEIIARSFGVPLEDVWVIGLPRNDQLSEHSEINPFTNNFTVWLPTYRRSVVGELGNDGDARLGLPTLQAVQELVSSLDSVRQQLVVKLHPMADPSEGDVFRAASVTVIDDLWLSEHDTTLYALLSCSSALITDYSSVAIDYLVTGKPMVLVQQDRRDYGATRGLNFEPTELAEMAPVVESYDELPSALLNCLNFPSYFARAELFYSAPADHVADTLLDRLLRTSQLTRTT